MELRPLESTKQDVEKLLGPPTSYDAKNAIAHYNAAKGNLHIFYSLGKCDATSQNWSVPADLMTDAQLMFEDDALPLLSDYVSDPTKFLVKKTKDSEFFYKLLLSTDRSRIYAIAHSKKRIDLVSMITLGPPKTNWDKRCKQVSTNRH